MKRQISILALSLSLASVACGGTPGAVLDINGGSGNAAPADANNTVSFSFLSMQDINVTGATVHDGNTKVTSLKPEQIKSATQGGTINYSVSSSDKIKQLQFIVAAPGQADAVLATVAGPLTQTGGTSVEITKNKDFAHYFSAAKFTIKALVTYSSAIPDPALTQVNVQVPVETK